MKLPNNKDLERHFIGQSILEKRMVGSLSTEDFYDSNYRAIWAAICELDESGHEVEPFAIAKLAKETVPGVMASEIAGMAIGLVYADQTAPLVEQLKELSSKRYLLRSLNVQMVALQDGGTAQGTIVELETLCEKTRVDGANGFESLASIIETEVKPALADLVHGQTKKIPTGFSALDRAIGGGFTLSDVVLIVSDTGAGKSAFVLQLADQLAKAGNPVAFVSGEMRNRENGLRLLSQNANVTNLNSAVRISQSEKDLLDDWADAIKDRPIYFDHASGDLQTVKKNLRALIKQKGVKVLVLDYIQLYRLTKNDKFQRVERLTEVSQEVKRIANEFGICVIEVAQFNREGAKKEKPSMHDLEGSGQLEKDTSLIFIIDRMPASDDIELRIAKGRNSAMCSLQGIFTGRTLRFEL